MTDKKITNKKLSIVVLGYAIPKSDFEEMTKKDKFPQVQGTKLMWRLIKGIEAASGRSIDLIGSAPASDFPRNSQLFFKCKKWSHKEGACDVTIPFINIFFLKHFSKFIFTLLLLFKWLRNNKNHDDKHIFVYSMHSPFICAALITKIFLNVKVSLIVLDLPEFMNLGIKTNIIRRIAKNLDTALIKGAVMQMDGLIALTQHTCNLLGRPSTPKLVVEGAVSLNKLPTNFNENCKRIPNKKVIMFSGALVGIEVLLSAFKLINDPNLHLYISGKGPLEADVVNATKLDSRIQYFGFLSTGLLLEKMLEATVFINVRASNTPFIQYSFPSKLLEYMSTGRPTISTALPGIPEEYYKYLYLITDETADGIAKVIIDICSKESLELAYFGNRARHFVQHHKNLYTQGKKIYDFFETL